MSERGPSSRVERIVAGVVERIGIAPFLARGIVARTLAETGVALEHAEPERLLAALPRLSWRLAMYFTREEVLETEDKIRAWLERQCDRKQTPATITPSDCVITASSTKRNN